MLVDLDSLRNLSNAEVGQHEAQGRAFADYEDIARLDVSMDDMFGVGLSQRTPQLDEQFADLRRAERLAPVQQGLQILPLNKLQDQDQVIAADKVVLQADDARMGQPRQHGRLNKQTLQVTPPRDYLESNGGVRMITVVSTLDDTVGAAA